MSSPPPRQPGSKGLRLEFVETPNPHALKCVLGSGSGAAGTSGNAVGPTLPFRSAAEAAGHPLAAALFRVNGVTGVLIGPSGDSGNGEGGGDGDGGGGGDAGRDRASVQWFTVNKSAAAAWSDVKKGIRAAVQEAGVHALNGDAQRPRDRDADPAPHTRSGSGE